MLQQLLWWSHGPHTMLQMIMMLFTSLAAANPTLWCSPPKQPTPTSQAMQRVQLPRPQALDPPWCTVHHPPPTTPHSTHTCLHGW
jgi:hypothetical protein